VPDTRADELIEKGSGETREQSRGSDALSWQ